MAPKSCQIAHIYCLFFLMVVVCIAGWCMGMKKISRISGALLISMLFSSILSGVVLVIMGEVRNHPYLDF